MKIFQNDEKIIFKFHLDQDEQLDLDLVCTGHIALDQIKVTARHGVAQHAHIEDKLLSETVQVNHGFKSMFTYMLGRSVLKDNPIATNAEYDHDLSQYIYSQTKQWKRMIHRLLKIKMVEKKPFFHSMWFKQCIGSFAAFCAMFVSLTLIATLLLEMTDGRHILKPEVLIGGCFIYVLKDRIKDNIKWYGEPYFKKKFPLRSRTYTSKYISTKEMLTKTDYEDKITTPFGDESTFLKQYKYQCHMKINQDSHDHIVPEKLCSHHRIVCEISISSKKEKNIFVRVKDQPTIYHLY